MGLGHKDVWGLGVRMYGAWVLGCMGLGCKDVWGLGVRMYGAWYTYT